MSAYTEKELNKLKKEELVALCVEEGIEVPEENTNKQLKELLMSVAPDAPAEGEGEEGEGDAAEDKADEKAEKKEDKAPAKKPVGALQKPLKNKKPTNLPEGMCAYECVSGRVNIGDGNLYEKGSYIKGGEKDPTLLGLVDKGVLSVA